MLPLNNPGGGGGVDLLASGELKGVRGELLKERVLGGGGGGWRRELAQPFSTTSWHLRRGPRGAFRHFESNSKLEIDQIQQLEPEKPTKDTRKLFKHHVHLGLET